MTTVPSEQVGGDHSELLWAYELRNASADSVTMCQL